jgi:hypothetical protein
MPSYRIKDWNKFQHFKDRKPPWVKLYRDILDDMEWHELDPQAAKALVMFWLIASETDGCLPDTKKLAFRLRTTENDVKKVISQLSHWLEQVDIGVISSRYQDDPLETETETETEEEREAELNAPSEKISLNAAGRWDAIPELLLATWKEAYPALSLDAELSKAAAWIIANPKNKKSNYARFLTNWLTRAQDKAPAQRTGQPRGQSWSEKNEEVIAQLTGRNRYEPDDRTIDV